LTRRANHSTHFSPHVIDFASREDDNFAAPKQKVRERIQADRPFDSDRLKNFTFAFPKIMICSAHPAAA